MAKLHTYAEHTEPFLHVDSDIYIWKPFPEELFEAEIYCQNLEIDFEIYTFFEKGVCTKAWYNSESNPAFNAGIFGGKNIEFFKELFILAKTILKENRKLLVNLPYVNNFLEQILSYSLAKSLDIASKTLFKEIKNPKYPNFADLHLVPEKKWYVHAMAE